MEFDDLNTFSLPMKMLESVWDTIMGGADRRAKVEEICSTIQIPSQPKVMKEINLEFSRKDVNFSRIGTLISRDVGLSAKLLKVANSPLFCGRAKVESIDQALMILGAKQFKQTILASALRQAYENFSQATEDFWLHSESTALICDHIARQLHPELAEYSFMLGLFHDCSVPILLNRSVRYKKLFGRVLARDHFVIREEEEACDIDHGAMGLVMARSWSIPLPIVKVIRTHHTDEFVHPNDHQATILHSILAVAENYFLYAHQQPDEIFAENRNLELLQKLQRATDWSAVQILELAKELDARFKST